MKVSIELFTIIVLELICFTSSNICFMKPGAPLFGMHIFNIALKFTLIKNDVPLCVSGCEYVTMNAATMQARCTESPWSGVTGGGCQGSILLSYLSRP